MCKRFILYALKPFQGETLTQLLKGGESYLSEKEAVENHLLSSFQADVDGITVMRLQTGFAVVIDYERTMWVLEIM